MIDFWLICENDVIDNLIDKFGTGVKTSRVDKEHFRAIVNVAVNHVFFSWVFGFENKVQIESPREVKYQYIDMLNKAISYTKKDS